MEKKIGQIEKEMCNIADEVLYTLQKDIAEIKVALLGNEYNPSGGLLHRTAQLEIELTKLRSRYEKIMWTVVGASAIIGALFNVLMQLWDKLFVN
jgi:hypothetical protein